MDEKVILTVTEPLYCRMCRAQCVLCLGTVECARLSTIWYSAGIFGRLRTKFLSIRLRIIFVTAADYCRQDHSGSVRSPRHLLPEELVCNVGSVLVWTAMDSWDKSNIHSETARLAEYPLYGPYIRCTLCTSLCTFGPSDDLSVSGKRYT